MTAYAGIYSQLLCRLHVGQVEGRSTPLLEQFVRGTHLKPRKELNTRAARPCEMHQITNNTFHLYKHPSQLGQSEGPIKALLPMFPLKGATLDQLLSLRQPVFLTTLR
ncbi:hypothetical protein MA16_Dca011537 [Dendrobium catenatum]|uniref:Uncharacterized protein n=1 Tax=Dendrobium catenatum TaxID=906689 RepID=A0A2I0W611_9ASPA|nr:hypothetical protein MA16_Dca011537 [Dendrobium catenatum]